MIRRSHEEVVRHGAPAPGRRRTTGGRALTLGMLGMMALLLLTACGPDVAKPYTTLSPESPTADDIHSLYKLVFWLALIVFVGVQFAIVYSALRFRRPNPGPDAPRPPQVHGNSRLEIIWTVIPAVVLLVVLIPTITTLYAAHDEIDKGTLEIDVYGKQWWWEVHYGEDQAQGENLGVITANEIHVPVGRNVVFNLYSNNVIHSFWVPQLSGKLDVVPGHKNQLSITADKPGTYYGECAEFCGTQHAWMRFTVVAHPEDEFYAWVNGERAGNPAVTYSKDGPPEGVVQAPQAFSVCLSCHTVNGINPYAVTGLDAPASYGPDLTNLACRESIAAGMLVNNEENRAAWVDDPGGVKPGNYMADQITPGLIMDTYGEDGFNELMDFLTSLQPAGGCDNPGAAATPVASPVASPVSEATPVG